MYTPYDEKMARKKAIKEERMKMSVDAVPIVGDLRNWVEGPKNSNGDYVIYGNIYNDTLGRFPDGLSIRTSEIVKVENGVALTLNSAYRLVDKNGEET